jgi:hemolysin III
LEEQHHGTEEILNALTHGIGAFASFVAGIVLIVVAARFGDVWQIVSVVVYSLSLVVLYSASALYHSARRQIAKRRLRVFDHCAIYVLIAGTYTPFALGPLRGPLGWTLLALVWTLAAIGIGYRCLIAGSTRASAAAYLAMSWICLIGFVPSLRLLATPTLVCLIAGGVAYTAGTIFYNSRRIPFAHPIWHGFVLAGSALHYAAVLTQISV